MNKDIPSNCENPGDLLKQRQAYSLKGKIFLSKERIKEWYEHWDGMVYVSFSGGKDSTVLLHLVRSMYPEVPAVFSDTGLEYPEIKDFVRTVDNVTWIRPKLSYRQVIEKYGYAVDWKVINNKRLFIVGTKDTFAWSEKRETENVLSDIPYFFFSLFSLLLIQKFVIMKKIWINRFVSFFLIGEENIIISN